MSMMYLHSVLELSNDGETVMKLLTRHGLGPLHEARNATSHEVLNGEFSIEFEYPANGDLHPEYGDIVMACPRPNARYFPFIITDYDKPVDGVIKYHAVHWSILLSGISVTPFKITESQTTEGGQTVTHDGVLPDEVFRQFNEGLHCEPAVQIPLFNNRVTSLIEPSGTTPDHLANCWPLGLDSGPVGQKDVVFLRNTWVHWGPTEGYRTIPPDLLHETPIYLQPGDRVRLISQETTDPYWYKIERVSSVDPNNYVTSDPRYTALEPAIEPGWRSHGGFLRLISDINEYRPFILESPDTLKAVMGDGIEGGSMINVYEGEYIYEPVNYGDEVNYIRFVKSRGEKKAITLQYGINMTDFDLQEDFSDVYTDIMPIFVKDDGTTIVGDIISSTKTFPITKVLPVDVSSEFSNNNNPTKAQVTEAGQAYFDREKPDEVDITLSIKTDEPSDFMDVDLGDIITVYHEEYNYSAEVRCTEYIGDISNDKITELVFERHVTRDKDVVSRIASSGNDKPSGGGGSSGGSSSGGYELSNATPMAVGTASPGTAVRASRSDHVHPATAPTQATSDNSTKIATTAFVKAAIAASGIAVNPSSTTPKMDGTASKGTENAYARGDHVHPRDSTKQDVLTFDSFPTAGSDNPVTSDGIHETIEHEIGLLYNDLNSEILTRAPLESPVFTGTPKAPTPESYAHDKEIVTAEWVRDYGWNKGTGFKGVINAYTDITNSLHYIEKGWYWVVGTAGTYAGKYCEKGDFIYAIETYFYGTRTVGGTDYKYGDVNMDGFIRGTDASVILRHIDGTERITDNDVKKLADVDGDGLITTRDAKIILNSIVEDGVKYVASLPDDAFAIVQAIITPITNSEIDTIVAS